MLFHYMVIEVTDHVKSKPVIMNETELQARIEQLWKESLGCMVDNQQYTIITEKAGWYKVHYGSKKTYIRYKMIK